MTPQQIEEIIERAKEILLLADTVMSEEEYDAIIEISDGIIAICESAQ